MSESAKPAEAAKEAPAMEVEEVKLCSLRTQKEIYPTASFVFTGERRGRSDERGEQDVHRRDRGSDEAAGQRYPHHEVRGRQDIAREASTRGQDQRKH